MSTTFARAARHAASGLAAAETVENALRVLGSEVDSPFEALTVSRRAQLANRFSRNLRGVGVARAKEVERLVLHAVEAMEPDVQVVGVRDALSVIGARNVVNQALTQLGFPWAHAMRLVASFSELVRHVADLGGGVLEVTVQRDGALCLLRCERLVAEQADAVASLRELGVTAAVGRDAYGSRLELSFPPYQATVRSA